MEVEDKARQMLEEAVKIRASDIFFLPKKGATNCVCGPGIWRKGRT